VTTTGTPGAGLQPDPLNPSQDALVIFGTSGDDHIQVKARGTSRTIEVTIDGKHDKFVQDFDPATFDRIIIYGLDGRDNIEVDNKIALPAVILGGAGDDHIQAGGGATIEVGGPGNDQLQGGAANDVLIGGTGSDHLEGNGGDNIQAAGTTDYDDDITALGSIMNVWQNTTGANFQAQVAALESGPYKLDATTAHDDGAGNQLNNGHALDWFFANLDGVGNNGVRDKINAYRNGGKVTKITL
jgi:Ca2+-binding RTX toxin-like protein